MNLTCKIGLATAAIAATLAIACNFFESNDAVNTTPSPTRIEQTTPAIDATSHISDAPSPTLRLDPDRQPVQHQPRSTRTEPTPLNEADQKLTEDKRWCQAWALENLDPHVYFEFAKLDPANMDDLQRTVWRKQLASSGANTDLPTYRQEASHPMPIGGDDKNEKTCRVYWAEPLSKANADKRNRQHETGCLYGLALEADRKWAELAQAAVRGGDTAAYDIPNQYVRVLRWMHLTGDEILNMTEPPSELLKRLSDKKYAYNSGIPSTSDITNLEGTARRRLLRRLVEPRRRDPRPKPPPCRSMSNILPPTLLRVLGPVCRARQRRRRTRNTSRDSSRDSRSDATSP